MQRIYMINFLQQNNALLIITVQKQELAICGLDHGIWRAKSKEVDRQKYFTLLLILFYIISGPKITSKKKG